MPRVVMKAGMRSLVTNTPFTKPHAVATATVTSTPPSPPMRGTREAPSTPARADMEPTEMSKSPLMMQNTIPMEPMATSAEKVRLPARL